MTYPVDDTEVPSVVGRRRYRGSGWLHGRPQEGSAGMRGAQACAICGAAVLDMGLHANFHAAIDSMDRTLSDASARCK